MITLDEAKRLKAAGFEQDDSFFYVSHWHKNPSKETWSDVNQGAPYSDDWYAAPNSDELIAAIQERWGDSYVKLLYKRNPVHDLKWAANGQAGIPGIGSTLLTALVDLYYKLSEGEK